MIEPTREILKGTKRQVNINTILLAGLTTFQVVAVSWIAILPELIKPAECATIGIINDSDKP